MLFPQILRRPRICPAYAGTSAIRARLRTVVSGREEVADDIGMQRCRLAFNEPGSAGAHETSKVLVPLIAAALIQSSSVSPTAGSRERHPNFGRHPDLMAGNLPHFCVAELQFCIQYICVLETMKRKVNSKNGREVVKHFLQIPGPTERARPGIARDGHAYHRSSRPRIRAAGIGCPRGLQGRLPH